MRDDQKTIRHQSSGSPYAAEKRHREDAAEQPDTFNGKPAVEDRPGIGPNDHAEPGPKTVKQPNPKG